MKELLADVKSRLAEKNIYELRRIARAVGVEKPSDGKRERLIGEILKIASGEIKPAPRSARGPKPKSEQFDRQLVSDIRSLAGLSVHKNLTVADGADVPVSGVLVKFGKSALIRREGFLPSPDDIFLSDNMAERFKLSGGDFVEGIARKKGESGGLGLFKISSVNGMPPESFQRRKLENLTPVYPQERVKLNLPEWCAEARIINIFAPFGKGQRGVVLCRDYSRAADVLRQIASGICPDERLLTIALLIDARPEDVTLFKRSSSCRLYASAFGSDDGSKAAEFVYGEVKSRLECGLDTLVLTYGGKCADIKKLLSLAINAEEGGSVTVISFIAEGEGASLKGGANMLVTLGTSSSPAVDLSATYTVNGELLATEGERLVFSALRGASSAEVERLFKNFGDAAITEKFKNG